MGCRGKGKAEWRVVHKSGKLSNDNEEEDDMQTTVSSGSGGGSSSSNILFMCNQAISQFMFFFCRGLCPSFLNITSARRTDIGRTLLVGVM